MRTPLPLRRWAFALLLVVSPALVIAQPQPAATIAPRERIAFNDGWRFHRGDAPDADDFLTYEALRAWILPTGADLINEGVAKTARPTRPHGNPGGGVSFVQPGFDDSGWQALSLPHDWAIEGPFSADLPGETGKLPWQGAGWYRKKFRLEAGDASKLIALDIDGAMAFSTVWLNGRIVGGWPYGYTSYRLDLTPYLKHDGENVLAVRLSNPPDSSRWYPGSGLYRNVWLVKTPPVRIAQWGVFVSTPRVSAESAVVQVDVRFENTAAAKIVFNAYTELFELGVDGRPAGSPVATSEKMYMELDPVKGRETMRSLTSTVKGPKLWDLHARHRYVAVTTLEAEGKVIDREETRFGIRSIALDADRGFLLNGRVVPLRGVCMHHDLGALGAAVNVRALERQIEILQSMGCNAIRTSHNPPAPELLELCDRMGMLVMAEAFDCWRRGKKWPWGRMDENSPEVYYFDYAKVFDDWHERDLRALIRRDRNHPSVVMWSIGNEVLEQWFPDGWKMGTHLAGIVREEDRTRPLTSGFNGEQSGYTGFQTAVDAVGFNYRYGEYAPFRRRNPTIPTFSTESASTISSRGEYFFPVSDDKMLGRENFHVSSYDLSANDWSNVVDTEFRALDETPGTLGEFVWTGFDYLGEPTPYNSDTTNLLNFSDPAKKAVAVEEMKRLGRIRVPSRSSYFGIIDLAGFPKDRFYLYQARWRPDLPMAHILPHWDWPERVGQVTPVFVYSSGDEAELFLNGRSLGRKKRGKFEYRFRWDDVVYAPGELKVVAYKNGAKWAESVRRTTSAASKLILAADRATIRADGKDLAFVTVTVADKDGLMAPRAKNVLKFELTGPGEILATDNGDPTSLVSFPSKERAAFNGLALVIVRAKAGEAGRITLKATGEGVAPTEIALKSE